MKKKKKNQVTITSPVLHLSRSPCICCIVYGELLEEKKKHSENVGTCRFSWNLNCSFGPGRRLRGRTRNTLDVPAQLVPVLADCRLRSMEEQSSSVTMETGTC